MSDLHGVNVGFIWGLGVRVDMVRTLRFTVQA